MANIIAKDSTYYPVHSTKWDKDNDTPADFPEPHKGKTVVLELSVAGSTWYQWLSYTDAPTLDGWYELS